MEHLMSAMDRSQGFKYHGKMLVDEMKELGKLRTAIMVEKCQIKNEKVMCPKPRKCARFNGDNNELKVTTNLSDIIFCKASPPYYAGSPPIRTRNPLIHDTCFHENRTQRSSQVSMLAAGLQYARNPDKSLMLSYQI